MATDMLCQMLDLEFVIPSGPVEFRGLPASPKIAYRAIGRDLLEQLPGGTKQVQRGLKDLSVQAFKQIEQLAFAASTVHGR